jgi:biopolymer transport protein ExbD
MARFEASYYIKQRPNIQMTAMIDIMFINLLFFMSLFVYFHFETELNISVPKSSSSVEAQAALQEIVINVERDGTTRVNQKQLTHDQLSALLQKTAEIYPAQSVVVRADEKAYHEYVVRVLDACAKAKIWNISFATTKEK